MTVTPGTSDVFIGVAQHDATALESLFQARLDNLEASGLDPKTYSLANIAALIAAAAARIGDARAVGLGDRGVLTGEFQWTQLVVRLGQ